jgi:hypothetical protein
MNGCDGAGATIGDHNRHAVSRTDGNRDVRIVGHQRVGFRRRIERRIVPVDHRDAGLMDLRDHRNAARADRGREKGGGAWR